MEISSSACQEAGGEGSAASEATRTGDSFRDTQTRGHGRAGPSRRLPAPHAQSGRISTNKALIPDAMYPTRKF